MPFHKHVQFRKEKFGGVVFDTLREKVFVVNASGADVVRLLKEGKSVEEIIKEMEALYEDTNGHLRDEVLEFIDSVTKCQLLEAH